MHLYRRLFYYISNLSGVKSFFISLTFVFILPDLIVCQSLHVEKINPFANSFSATIEIGGTVPKTDYKIDELSISGKLLFEYFFKLSSISALGIRFSGSSGIIKGQVFSNDISYPPVSENFNTDFYSLGAGVVYALYIGSGIPYCSASISYLSFNPLDENGYKLVNNQFSVYKKDAMLYTLEVGVRFPFADTWSLNLGVDYNFSSTDYLDDVMAGYNNDAFFSFFSGVSLYFGKDLDSDNDGVADDFDLCPDTPLGTEVNEFGCSPNELKYQETLYDTSKDHFLLDGIFSDGTLYCFQVDVFQEMNRAEELRNQIISLGYKADIFELKFGSRVWQSVRIGYFNSFDNAKIFKDNFFKSNILKLN
jgi:hypothetical protein